MTHEQAVAYVLEDPTPTRQDHPRQLLDALARTHACSSFHRALARGIDTFAHRAALASAGRTIAVLGSGLDRLYPEENRGLAAEMQEHGVVVTELPLGPNHPRGSDHDRLGFPALPFVDSQGLRGYPAAER